MPGRLPPETRMMSPRRRACRDRSASARRAADRCRAAAPSSSDSSLRSRAYSAKSPRSQLTASSASACLAALGLAGDAHHRPVGLELGERGLEQRGRALQADLADQVHRHVVGGPEARVERVGPGAGQPGHRRGVHARVPQHHRVALHVDPPPPGPAGQLRVLPRRQRGVGLAVPLVEPLDDDRAGRHVDPERQRLGREDRPHQPGLEQLLDHLLEGGQHARVVGGDTALQAGEPLAVAEHREVGSGMSAVRRSAISAMAAASSGVVSRRPASRHCRTAASQPGPAEDEGDRGQQAGRVQPPDHLARRRGGRYRAPRAPRGPAAGACPRPPAGPAAAVPG